MTTALIHLNYDTPDDVSLLSCSFVQNRFIISKQFSPFCSYNSPSDSTCGAYIYPMQAASLFPDYIYGLVQDSRALAMGPLSPSVTNTDLTCEDSNSAKLHTNYASMYGGFTGPRWFPTHRPVTRSFDVCFDLRPNKRLSKHCSGWWFEKPLHPLWRHCNESEGMGKYLHLISLWGCNYCSCP